MILPNTLQESFDLMSSALAKLSTTESLKLEAVSKLEKELQSWQSDVTVTCAHYTKNDNDIHQIAIHYNKTVIVTVSAIIAAADAADITTVLTVAHKPLKFAISSYTSAFIDSANYALIAKSVMPPLSFIDNNCNIVPSKIGLAFADYFVAIRTAQNVVDDLRNSASAATIAHENAGIEYLRPIVNFEKDFTMFALTKQFINRYRISNVDTKKNTVNVDRSTYNVGTKTESFDSFRTLKNDEVLRHLSNAFAFHTHKDMVDFLDTLEIDTQSV